MTRKTSKRLGGRPTRSGFAAQKTVNAGRSAARARRLCLALCCALLLQPTVLPHGGGGVRAAGERFDGKSGDSLAVLAGGTLLAAATAVTNGLRRLVPAGDTARGSVASLHGALVEPEPAAAAVVFLGAPGGLNVDSTSDTEIWLSWAAVAGAVSYRVERTPNLLTPYTVVGSPSANGFRDTGVSRGSTFLYRVRAMDSSGSLSPPGAAAMATAFTFLDGLIVANVTRVQAAHVNELRLAIAGVRRAAALPPASWQETVAAGVPVRAAHVRELRDSLGEALNALGLNAPAYTDATLLTGPGGTRVKKAHFDELRARSTRGPGVNASGLLAYDFASARLTASNRTGAGGGVDPLSRNFNWSLPVLSLPGRAGLDLGLTLAYNSLVWTKSGGYVLFDGDWGWPAPGFRLGFPVIQGRFFDAGAQRDAYLLLSPSGGRVSLRRTQTPGVYESGDSSYLQLNENADGSLTLLTPDGTRMTYLALGGAYKCAEVKDRHGNYISASYNLYGNVETITDTLGRVVNFVYYGDGYLKEITQTWHREVEGGSPVTETHRWARFYYEDKAVRTNFPGLSVFGPTAGQTFRALTGVKLADDSSFAFGYTTWAQVDRVAGYAPDGRLLNYVSLNLPADESLPQSACPRPSERRDWAAHWNGDEDGAGAPSEEAVTSYSVTDGATWLTPETGAQETGTLAQQTAPDGTLYKEYSSASGWAEGLERLSEVWSGGARKKWSSMSWTQDDEALTYAQNPRPRESNVYDANDDGSVRNRRRTEVAYTSFGLPEDVKEYDADAATVLRRTHMEYVPASVNAGGVYTVRRIIGLPLKREVYGRENGQEKLFAKVTLEYDLGGEFLAAPEANPASVTQHDETNFGAAFTARGDACRRRRWDAEDKDNQSKSVSSESGYNTLGAVVFTRDALGHQTGVSYLDSDGGTRLAYPTTVTDPGGFSTTKRYNYDMGLVVGSRTPLPNTTTNQPGPEVSSFYDAAGRALKVKRASDGAYTRWEYGASGLWAKQATITDTGQPETFSLSVTDGAGHVRGTLSELPGAYAARRFEYDESGRQFRQYNPIRVSVASDASEVAAWQPAGEDAPSNGGAGWVYSSTEFDWKGRPLLVTNVGSPATTKEFRYEGCGCSGGEGILTRDETGRRRKVTLDILGRTVKGQDLDELAKGLPLTDAGGVYRTVLNTYNALDQVTETQTFAGASETDPSKILKATTVFDGHGRPRSGHAPGQAAGGVTAYTYRADDTLESVIDARGVKVSYGQNSRHLIESISYDLSGVLPGQEVAQTSNVAFTFDAAGNRLTMSAGAGGSVSYTYSALSQLVAEARQFPGLPGAYTLSYQYTLSGRLKSVTDETSPSSPVGFAYEFDAAGQTKAVTSTGMGASAPLASNAEYDATGSLRHVEYGDSTAVGLNYDARGLLTGYTLSGAKNAQTGAARDEGGNFSYYFDGRLRYATDRLSRSQGTALLDRAYSYDLVGRLKEAYSGADARTFAGDSTPGSADVPYRQTYTYDVWNQQRDRTGHYWGEPDSAPVEFDPATGRDPSWLYDADGRLISMNEPSPNGLTYQPARFTYDAAGRRAQKSQTTSKYLSTPAHPLRTTAVNVTDYFDADGVEVKQVKVAQLNSNPPGTSSIYFLRSSVLGGLLIAEYGATGARQTSYAYARGELLAVQQGADTATPMLRWQHASPVTGDAQETDAAGRVLAETYLDPGGANVGASPFTAPEGDVNLGSGEGMSQASVNARVAQVIPGWGGPKCVYDGSLVGCGMVESIRRGGSVVDAESGFDPSDTLEVQGSRWVDKWEDCTKERADADICQHNAGHFEGAPNEWSTLTTYISQQSPAAIVSNSITEADRLLAKKRCRDFVQNVLGVNNPDGLIPRIREAELISNPQGFSTDGPGVHATASWTRGVTVDGSANLKIEFFKPFFVEEVPQQLAAGRMIFSGPVPTEERARSPKQQGQDTLHEGIHLWTGKTDIELANLLLGKGQKPFTDKLKASEFWHKKLMENCK